MKNRGIITADWDWCYICGSPYGLENHHCMHGTANKRLADKYGLYVPLCNGCHHELQNGKNGRPLDLKLMQEAQRKFEQKYTHEKWMQVFRKNFL